MFMNRIEYISMAGGLFAVLSFVHFFVDFICQTHFEAMNKHNRPWIRARHCAVYTVGFVPILCFFNFGLLEWLAAVNILFWSHFYLDTYHGVFLWAKYVRQPPEFKQIGTSGDLSQSAPADDKEAFVRFISTQLGKILMISIDQISHLSFLFPLVWMAMRHTR